ncbi:MAG: hypothetical protein ACLR8P_02805 [Clostridium fessum]
MLRESPVLTVLMLIGRGASIVWGGVSLLQMSWWLPFPLVFMLSDGGGNRIYRGGILHLYAV